jgi:hypothetical protein
VADRLSNYPFVELNLKCKFCPRAGSYRIVRLAAKYGAEVDLHTLLRYLAGDCEYWRPAHPYKPGCGAYFPDLEPPVRPPDLPVAMGRPKLIVGGKD